MAQTKLILRKLTSPYTGIYSDITTGSVLDHKDVDGNFIYLKGNIIYEANLSGTTLNLNKLNGDNLAIDLSGTVISVLPPVNYTETVQVMASSPNNYIGVGTPPITGYSSDVLYITTFDETNNNTATTINIDGVGSVNLYTATEDGLEGIPISSITSGITYFMIYNGSDMQLFDENPTSEPLTYTNLTPVPVTLGGISAGTTFHNATMQNMWDTLLYPYLNPSFTSFAITSQPTSLEVGASISGGPRTFTWSTSFSSNIQPNTIKIKHINTGTIISTPASGMSNDGSEVITIPTLTRTTAGNHRWTIYGTTINSVIISRNFQVNWLNRIYYGTSSLTALTASDITGLTSTMLATTSLNTYNFGSGGYKYICIPTGLPLITLLKDTSTNLSIGMAGVTDGYSTSAGTYFVQNIVVTNAFGIPITYRVYRTKNILGGSINIIAS